MLFRLSTEVQQTSENLPTMKIHKGGTEKMKRVGRENERRARIPRKTGLPFSVPRASREG